MTLLLVDFYYFYFCLFICLVIFGARGRARDLGWADVAV